MREENKILVEHKQMLEEQLESSRKRIQTIFSLENELYMVKRELGVAQMEMESDKKKIEELQEVNLFCLFIRFTTFVIRLSHSVARLYIFIANERMNALGITLVTRLLRTNHLIEVDLLNHCCSPAVCNN